MTYQILTKEELNRVLEKTSPHSFKFNIARMHSIFRLPVADEPTLAVGQDPVVRLEGFQKTLRDEVAEFDTAPEGKLSIRDKLLVLQEMQMENCTPEQLEEARQDVLADIADWLGDIIVYCRSEAMKFGIPLEDVLDAIMGSNFTKVGSVPKYDENGKVLKDLSRFVPPENAIRTIMFGVDSNGS